jgi:hypothetical protein
MNENKHLTPLWIVYVDGKRLDADHEGAMRVITVKERLDGISKFSILFDTSEVQIRDLGLFSLESEISIHLGYKDDIEEVFSGEVLRFREILNTYRSSLLEVTGSNILHKFIHASRFRNFEGKSPSDIIKGLADSYSLKSEVEDFGASSDFLTEEGQSDYEYLLKTANAYGKHVFANGSTLYVGSEISVRADEIVYEWGKSLVKFEGIQDISCLNSAVDYVGWDFLKNEPFIGHASLSDIPVKIGGSNDWTGVSKGGGGKFVETLTNYHLKDTDEAKQLALGRLQGNSFLFGYALGSGEGNYKLRPGMHVTVKMVGETFEGEYITQAATHNMNYHSGYTTDFILKRNMIP